VLGRCISDAACSRTFGTPTSGVWIIHPRTGVAVQFPPKCTFSRGWAKIANIVEFCNKRGTAEQCIKEWKGALKGTRLSCRSLNANAVRLQLHALAYNLGNLLRTLATPEASADWSLTSLREKLIKIGAKVVSHGRYVTFQMAEVAIPRKLFAAIMQRIAALRSPPIATAT
jgi:hypothetical protein